MSIFGLTQVVDGKYLNEQQSTIPTLLQGDQIASSDIHKAELLNAFFSSCFNTSHPPLTMLPADPSPSSDNDPSFDEMYCTISQVEQLLQDIEASKACGSDKISAQMLKHTASRYSIAPSVTKLFDLSIRVGKIPDKWKESMIAPIPKAATKSSDPGNYKPISLTCILCKLLEKHINYMVSCMNIYPTTKLSDSQWGFRSGRSMVTALLSVTQEWLSALECGQELCAVFSTIKKCLIVSLICLCCRIWKVLILMAIDGAGSLTI